MMRYSHISNTRLTLKEKSTAERWGGKETFCPSQTNPRHSATRVNLTICTRSRLGFESEPI